jgi:hypothetical protein
LVEEAIGEMVAVANLTKTKPRFEKVSITRRAAARAEIDTAIELLFDDREPVAIHVLTWAAVEMMRGIAESRGQITFQASMEDRIKSQFLGQWRKILKTHYNFFKHADRDPDSIAEDFMPEATTYPLFGACVDYQTIFGASTLAMMSYMSWFMARHPKFMKPQVAAQVSALATHLDYPDGKPFRESLREVAENYHRAKLSPSIVAAGLQGLGSQFEP